MVALPVDRPCVPSLEDENEELKKAIARLAEENARLVHEQLHQERTRLLQENAKLMMMSAPPPGLAGFQAPPGLVPVDPRWYVPKGMDASLSASVASTGVGSYGGSMISLSDDEDTESNPAPKTTLMLQNVPNNYSRRLLLDLLDEHGFAGHYNFVYLPMDFNTSAGFGYAFVNFIDTHSAEKCMAQLQGFRDWVMPSKKVCEIMWSNAHQGLEAHIDRYRNSPILRDSVPDEFKPVIFGPGGTPVPFPAPTKKIR